MRSNRALVIAFVVVATLTIAVITTIAATTTNAMTWNNFTISKALAASTSLQIASIIMFIITAPLLVVAIVLTYRKISNSIVAVAIVAGLMYVLVPMVSIHLSVPAHLVFAVSLFILLGLYTVLVVVISTRLAKTGDVDTTRVFATKRRTALIALCVIYCVDATALLAIGATGINTPAVGVTEYLAVVLFFIFVLTQFQRTTKEARQRA